MLADYRPLTKKLSPILWKIVQQLTIGLLFRSSSHRDKTKQARGTTDACVPCLAFNHANMCDTYSWFHAPSSKPYRRALIFLLQSLAFIKDLQTVTCEFAPIHCFACQYFPYYLYLCVVFDKLVLFSTTLAPCWHILEKRKCKTSKNVHRGIDTRNRRPQEIA